MTSLRLCSEHRFRVVSLLVLFPEENSCENIKRAASFEMLHNTHITQRLYTHKKTAAFMKGGASTSHQRVHVYYTH